MSKNNKLAFKITKKLPIKLNWEQIIHHKQVTKKKKLQVPSKWDKERIKAFKQGAVEDNKSWENNQIHRTTIFISFE